MKHAIHPRKLQAVFGRAGPAITLGALLLTLAAASPAQTIYRSVGPDGKVTFSDKPPAANASGVGTAGGAQSASGAALPFELRQASSRFPVTLYTSNGCAPCGAGRTLLANRGIPFTERTVNTAEDVEALKRLSGDGSLPVLTIGSQQLKGFSDTEWTQFLNAAGYPSASQLPANYSNPAATPLVTLQKPAPAAKPETQAPSTPAESSRPAPDTSNPAGISF